jgi:hypothetical protein
MVADAAVVAMDAAPAPASDGTLVVINDTWCTIHVNGAERGRTGSGNKKELRLPPGHYAVRCSQPAGEWTREVDILAGQPTAIQDAILKPVEVAIAISGDRIQIDRTHYPRGGKARLKPGRYRAVVVGGAAGWLEIPSVPRCTVHEVGNDLVCDP